MPVDKQVVARYKILDKLFRSEAGYTYGELTDELENYGIFVSERTLKADRKFFEDNYGAVFCDGLKRGKQVLVRYQDTDTSVFAANLSNEEKGIIGKLVNVLQLHNDIPQYQWAIFLLDGLRRLDEEDDLGNYVEFENNLDLEGSENFKILMEACMEKFVVSLKYASFKQSEAPKTYNVSPYLLKQYNNRWFLVCKRIGCEPLSTFPLDRIEIESIQKEVGMNYEEPDWDFIGEGLSHTIGMTYAFAPENRTDVILDIDKTRYQYIKTKPILPWQEVISQNEDKVRLRLEGITINKELISLLLSYGPDIEVIGPKSLREDICQLAKAMSSRYDD